MKRENAKQREQLIEQHRRRVEAMRSRPGYDPSETPEQKKERIRRVLDDPWEFAREYFSEYATSEFGPFQRKWFRRVEKNKRIRIVQRWPRAHAKSVISDLIMPIWLWARGEPMYLVIVGSSFDAAKTLLSDVQAEFEGNQKFLEDFGDQEMQGHWTDGRFTTKNGFTGQALGMGQNVRGLRRRAMRPTCIVMDDCETKDLVKNEKRQWELVRWVEGALLKTMDGPVQRFIMANNGYARNMVQRKLLKNHPTWELDEVKAYDKVTYECAWPQKYTPAYWKRMEEEDGRLSTYAEQLHEPHTEGLLFTEDLFNTGKPPRMDHLVRIVGHWDVAYAGTSTADYNAVRVWGVDKDRKFWLLATFCKQSKMRAAVEWMTEFDSTLPESVVVHWQYESQFWNDELQRTLDDVAKDTGHELLIAKAELVKANKYDRILSMHVYYQNGRVWFSDKLTGSNDHQVGLDQIRGIEPGYTCNDDAPDADERAITLLAREVRISNHAPPVFGARKSPKRLY